MFTSVTLQNQLLYTIINSSKSFPIQSAVHCVVFCWSNKIHMWQGLNIYLEDDKKCFKE